MSPIALSVNLFLALLLMAALMVGMSLNKRLKALRDGQAGFAKAVADLDRAAGRAQSALGELREATDESLDLLGGRIEKARELAGRLDGMINSSSALPRESGDPGFLPKGRAGELLEEKTPGSPLSRGRAEVGVRAPLRLQPLQPLPSPRSRARIDDDLFETPMAGVGR